MGVNLQMVEQLNRKSTMLNAQRQQEIGRQQATRNAYDKAVLAYKQKYGVEITDANIQQECNLVQAQLDKDYNELNQAILNIESGQYKVEQEQERERQRQAQLERQRQLEEAEAQRKLAEEQLAQADKQLNLTPNVGLTPNVQPVSAGVSQAPTERPKMPFVITEDMLSAQAKPTKPLVEVPDAEGFEDDDADTGVKFGDGSTQAPVKPQIKPSVAPPTGGAKFGEVQPQQVVADKKEEFTYEDEELESEEETVQVTGWGSASTGKTLDINSQFAGMFGK